MYSMAWNPLICEAQELYIIIEYKDGWTYPIDNHDSGYLGMAVQLYV